MAKRTRKSIVNKLDDLCRQIIRLRDGGVCQWCGKSVTGKDAQCSHVRSRKYYNTRWSLQNLKLLCASCHFKWHDDPTAGAAWFSEKFPARQAWIDEARKETTGTIRDSDLLQIESELKQKLVELKSE